MDKLEPEVRKNMESVINEKISPLKRSRATHKRKITLHLKSLDQLLGNNELTITLNESRLKEIEKEKDQIRSYDDQINLLMDGNEFETKVTDYYEKELDDQTNYSVEVDMRLDSFKEFFKKGSANSDKSLVDLAVQMKLNEARPPPLECSTFSGKERDKFAFNNFLNQFNTVIGSKVNLSKSSKLAYLIGYLRDYALSIVKHLSITDDNYDQALKLLKQEFLDQQLIIDETYKNIMKASPSYNNDFDFSSVKAYLNEIRSYVYELKAQGLDLLERDSAGLSLISHIVFNKLPVTVKSEFIHFLGKTYPNLNELFDKYHEVIAILNRTSAVRPKPVNHRPQYQRTERSKLVKPNNQAAPQSKGTFQNFKSTMDKKVECKLCGSNSHPMSHCEEFNSYRSKVDRLRELTLCIRCAGHGHNENNCFGKQGKLRYPCKICGTREHFTVLCPSADKEPRIKTNSSLCLAQRSFDSCQMLPTMTLTLKCGSKRRKVRCLVDTGSQRSYLSESIAKHLCHDIKQAFVLDCDVSTYLSQDTKEFKQMSTGIKIGKTFVSVPLLIDSTFDITYDVPGMSAVVSKFKENNIRLLDEAFNLDTNHDQIKVDMLMGIDVLQHMTYHTTQLLGGSCIVMFNKISPVGNIFRFLDMEQRKAVRNNLKAKTERVSNNTKTVVNAVMDPLKSYFNPLENILTDSEVDNGLENLFRLESMGIKTDDKELVSVDQEHVEKFREGIKFEEEHYQVELPWYDDKINSVPSNHNVALKVLDRTIKQLQSKNLIDKYQAVFDQQLAEGIIEEIKVKPSEYKDKIWIPHRPIIKMDEQVTTKIRPVFNCSLKTEKELPSLNEAAYTGIDMMNNILQMLFLFRSNHYVMLSDVKQAFLMIKLKKEEDQNRFCFFWKRGNKLVTYRFKSIVFGFTSSPFILHYVMQHHANTFPNDKVSHILSNNFYVDNLIITGNDISDLQHIYHEAYDRMKAGGFTLRSWTSNSHELRHKMAHDGKLVEHTSEEEKVLGYKYNVKQDTLSIAPCKLDSEANTKRKVLSQTSKLFDPINFALPITIRGKILMRKIWKLGLGWDDQLPQDITNEMKKLSKDLNMVSELSFPRQALNENNSYGLHIFCDSSAEAYGFVAYAVDSNNVSTFVYAKSKLAPLNRRNEHSIPTLELMGVILALKCLPSILDSYKSMQIQFINICVDAQVVLNWLLTKETKVKSKFLRNRVKDALCFKDELIQKYNIPVAYHYVNTDHNPADLVTKGLSFNKYLDKMHFWLQGPQWLCNNFKQWPEYPLLSISPSQKQNVNTLCTTLPPKVNTGVININKYSSLNRLIKCTSYLYKFLSKVKDCDPQKRAWNYWIKTAQQEYFAEELTFLLSQTNKDKVAPLLVSNLNLFLDPQGIIRSRGRISKCLYYNYDIHNPVLLPRESRFTQLFILDSHVKMQHLGIGTTLNYIREQGFWIPKGRMAVKSALSTCRVCKKYNTLAFKYPKFTDMPKHHMNLVKPFQHVGVDYTGHFWVKDNVTAKAVKVYVLVFTCLNIRAVHFELLTDMSAKNFLMAFQRFCNTYSIPQYIYSDNAKSFLKGGLILENALQSQEFEAELEKCNIKHIKIPIYSAWIGSAWERLIRTMKNCLYKVVGRAKLTYYELLTSLSSIQLAMNSRPLTYRSSSDNLEFITPNSFLKFHGNSSIILRDDCNVWVDEAETLENTLAIQEENLDKFKRLWYSEYLLSLREHSRNLYQSSWENRIRVGDVVLIKAINKPRPYWIMGKILEVIMGPDSKIRTVKVKQGNGAIEYHSICNLYPLEVSVTHAGRDEAASQPVEDNDNSVESYRPTPVRPKRKATQRFERMLRDNLHHL